MTFSVIARSFHPTALDDQVDVTTHHDSYVEALEQYRRIQRERFDRFHLCLMLTTTGPNVDSSSVQPDDDYVLRCSYSPIALEALYPTVELQAATAGRDLPTLQRGKYLLLDLIESRRAPRKNETVHLENLVNLLEALQDQACAKRPLTFGALFPDAPANEAPDHDQRLSALDQLRLLKPEKLHIQWTPEDNATQPSLIGRAAGETVYRITTRRLTRKTTLHELHTPPRTPGGIWETVEIRESLSALKNQALQHLLTGETVIPGRPGK